MSKYIIEDKPAIRTVRSIKYPLTEMKVGQSFSIPVEEGKNATTYVSQWALRRGLGEKYTVVSEYDKHNKRTSYRVGRVK